MSTIKVDSIQATDETVSRAVSGVAGAWVSFNGTGTVAIRDSQNVASILDNSTGNYRVNFSSGMANDDFFSFGGQVSTSGANIRVSGPNNGGNRSSTYQNVESYQQGTGGVDKENVGCGIMGDLA